MTTTHRTSLIAARPPKVNADGSLTLSVLTAGGEWCDLVASPVFFGGVGRDLCQAVGILRPDAVSAKDLAAFAAASRAEELAEIGATEAPVPADSAKGRCELAAAMLREDATRTLADLAKQVNVAVGTLYRHLNATTPELLKVTKASRRRRRPSPALEAAWVDLQANPQQEVKAVAERHGITLNYLSHWLCENHRTEWAALKKSRAPITKPSGQLL